MKKSFKLVISASTFLLVSTIFLQSGAILAEEINIKKEIDSYVLGTEADVILNEMLINEEDDKFINDSYEELKNKVELSEKIVNKEVVDKQGDSNVKVENTIDDVKIEHNSKDDVNEVKKYNQSDDSKEKVSSGNDSVDTLEGNTSSKMRMKRSLDVMEPLIPNFEDSINYYLSSLTVDEVNALKNAKSFEERSVLLERILNKKIDEQYALGELDDLKKQLTDEELRDLYEGDSTQAFESKLKKIYFDYQQSLNLQELIDELIVLSTEDEYNQLLNAKSEEDLAETIESLSIKKSQELSNQSSTSRRRKRFAPALVFPVIAYGPQIVAAAVATGKVIAAAAAVGVAAYGAHQAYNHYKVSHSQAKSNAVQRQHTRAQNASRSRERSRARQQAQTQARNYSKTPAGHSAVSQLASNGSYYGNTYNRLGQVAANLFYSYGSQLIPSYNLTGTKHQVLPNESVWSISNQYGISMTDLIAWNGIQNNLIHPGQQLLVRPDTISEDGTKHQVLPNESVWSISNQYGISMTDLIAWNGIQNNLIHPGQQLFIRPTNITNSRTKDKIYKVQSGDSVWKIAHENGITMDDLIRWNDIRNNTIHPGQQLIVKPGTKTPINTPEAPIKDKIYKVQSGDSVWKIAHENGITMDDLIRWNDIRNNTIHPGQQLIIKPGTKTPINTPEAPIKDKIYKVQSGDSVWKIAHENGITMDDLIRWNDIRNNTIHPGQQLIIKPGTKTPINTPEAPIKDKIYKVQSGDSVWKIAHENGITMDDLIRWNNINGNLIHPGQKLIVEKVNVKLGDARETYGVQSGDSVWLVANKYGITMDELIEWNNIQNYTIHPGQNLIVESVTAKEARKAAEELGYEKTNERSHGEPVFKNTKKSPKFITPDNTGHKGGVWKGADSVKDLKSKTTRKGTYDKDLNKIAD